MAETGSVSDAAKRNLIVERLGVGPNTAASLTGERLNAAYLKALKEAEAPAPVIPKRNKGGAVKKKKLAKGGFPDLSGDGKVTQKDVLMGRGAMNKGGMYAAGGYVTDMMGKKKK